MIGLSARQCKLVQASFAQLDSILDDVAAVFYRRLFDLDPNLRPLFANDAAVQNAKFVETLAVTVKGLEDLEGIAPFVRALGCRHAAYGVKAGDYATVGAALLYALEEGLGPALGDDVHDAWFIAYDAISRVMIEGATA